MIRHTQTENIPIIGDIKVVVPASLQCMTNFVLHEQGDWFEDEIKFVRSFIAPGMKVVDIGANYGVYALTMAKLTGKTGFVWAFEPARATAECLRKSIEINEFSNLNLLQAALSDHKGAARLFLSPNSELNSLSNSGRPGSESEMITLTTLDDCMRELEWDHLDFIKLDAEGEEANILTQGRETLSTLSPLIMYEVNNGGVVNLRLIEQFTRMGYQTYRLVTGQNVLIPFDRTKPADPTLLNLFACKVETASQLEDRGVIVRHISGGCVSYKGLAKEYLEQFPFAKQIGATSATPAFERYMEVLEAYIGSLTGNGSAGNRTSCLMEAVGKMRSLLDAGEQRLERLVTFSRIAFDAGERTLGVSILSGLINRYGKSKTARIADEVKEPFLPASPRFDQIDPGDRFGEWLFSSILERLIEKHAWSSYFSGQAVLPLIMRLDSMGFSNESMRARLGVMRRVLSNDLWDGDPAMVRAKKNQAQALMKNNRLDEARALYQSICDLNPRDTESWVMLGVLSSKMGNYDEAARYYTRACELAPNNLRARYNLGAVLYTLGKLDEAEAALRATISLEANHQPAWSLLAHVLVLRNKPDEADRVYASAVGRFRENFVLHANYAATLRGWGRLTEAAHLCREAIRLSPNTAWLHDLMSNILIQQGLHDEAGKSHARALGLAPNDRRIHSNWLLHQHYLIFDRSPDLVAAHRNWPGNRGQMRRTGYPNDTTADRRLRIGYISSDFRNHSVAYFVQNLLSTHRRHEVEIYCYADGPQDEMTDKLTSLADQWRVVSGMQEAAAANLIEKDRIDILVELTGHTSARILSVAALQPAPVQVTYLGYPDTTGLVAIDYRISDAVADPPGTDQTCTEKLVRIPGCFLCYRAPDESPEVAPAPCTGNGHITFGSFNNFAKLNERVVELWARLLRRVPDSRLYLKNQSLADEGARLRIRNLFTVQDISSERLILKGPEPGTLAHLARYAAVDIGLDTFPYCGTTTTCEALWMGVPVITLTGTQHAGRVGTSLLKAAGYPEWIARTPEEYIDIAAGLTENLDELASLRTGVRDHMARSILCDAARFTGLLEQAYREMWHAWIAGKE